jgi:hypothetical protein
MFARKRNRSNVSVEKRLSQYDVAFEAVFDEPDTRQCFERHLKKIHNNEPLLFLCDLERYITLLGPRSRYLAAKKIVTTYLAEEAMYSVNVSHLQKQKVIQEFKKCSESDCSINLFDELRLSVYIELKQDCFGTFLRSESFHKYIEKQLKRNPDYIQTLGAPKSRIMLEELESIETNDEAELSNLGVLYDPNRVEATDADFDRLLNDIRDKDMWKPVFQSEVRSVYVSKSPYFSGKKGLKKMYETGILPCSVDEAFNVYADYSELLTIEKEISNVTAIEYKELGRFAVTVLRFQYKLPFPLKNRDFCLLHSVRKEPNGDVVMIRKSINHKMCPRSKNYVRGVVSGGIAFEKIDENTTRYSQSYFVDYGGWINSSLFNKIIEMRDNSWHEAFLKAVESRRGLGRPVVSNRVIDTLEYFEQKSLMFTY